jgi:predicted nucleotidyltransferase
MIEPRAIIALADEIVRQFDPERIILFGSQATGLHTEDSDVDLLVVMPYRGASYTAASRIRQAVDVAFSMDILVRSPSELKRRLAINDFFLADIIEHGLVLHDSNNHGVGEQSRRRLRRRLHPAALAKAQPV